MTLEGMVTLSLWWGIFLRTIPLTGKFEGKGYLTARYSQSRGKRMPCRGVWTSQIFLDVRIHRTDDTQEGSGHTTILC